MKKTLSLVTVVCMIVALISSFGCVSASADTAFVNLYSAEVYFSKYGVTDRYIYIQTDGAHNDQEVYAHYKFARDYNVEEETYIWSDSKAEYVTTLDDGSKIWKASIRSSGVDCEYAIKYVANGVEYWNNNNGENFGAQALGTANVTVNRGGCNYYYGANISAVVKNLAYNKNVVVRVTYDNWNSYEDVPMVYNMSLEDGTETWRTHIDRQISDYNAFHYCIYYQVNGQTYWANNFGANYDTTTKVYPY